jgi:starch phosphorylase
MDEIVQVRSVENESPRWFQQAPHSPLTSVAYFSIAYFSMEYMLSEAWPIHSGGLGKVVGDQLKSATDLGVPAVGVGLLYSQGYFRQLDRNGAQRALNPFNDPGQLPVSPARDANGDWLCLTVPFPAVISGSAYGKWGLGGPGFFSWMPMTPQISPNIWSSQARSTAEDRTCG